MKKKLLLLVAAMLALFAVCLVGCDSLDLTGCSHEYEVVSITPASCGELGLQTERCRLCEKRKRTSIPALGHDYRTSEVVAPTCTAEGYTAEDCSRCEATRQTNVLSSLSHEYQVVEEVGATCTAVGFTDKACTRCEATQTTVLQALGHDYQISEVVAPTCTTGGYTDEDCSRCEATRQTNVLSELGHDYQVSEVVAPACTTGGYTDEDCSRCEATRRTNELPAAGHSFGGWETVKVATEVNDGKDERRCVRCPVTEVRFISSTSYVNLAVIKEEFNADTVYEIDSYEQLSLKFQAAVINLAQTFKCRLNYSVENQGTLLTQLVDDCERYFSYSVQGSWVGNEFTFTFTHAAEPSQSTGEGRYTQYASVNYSQPSSARTEQFDAFEIYGSNYSFTVKTTDQLYYALERGVIPVCVAGSNAERAFAQLKTILIEIVDDDMTDAQKVRAIHDYLVMNVTYDKVLYSMAQTGQSLSSYNSFYLDGVLFDQVAVCEGISKAMTALCNMEGIPCVTVVGYQTGNAQGLGHAWNKVYVNGAWYVIDATSDGLIINDEFEVLSYEFFLVSEVSYNTLYTAENFTNIVCESDYNIYQESSFSYGGQAYDFVVSSQSELNILVAYFEGVGGANTTVEFQVGFEVGDSAADEVVKAYQANGMQAACAYIDNGTIFMLVK